MQYKNLFGYFEPLLDRHISLCPFTGNLFLPALTPTPPALTFFPWKKGRGPLWRLLILGVINDLLHRGKALPGAGEAAIARTGVHGPKRQPSAMTSTHVFTSLYTGTAALTHDISIKKGEGGEISRN